MSNAKETKPVLEMPPCGYPNIVVKPEELAPDFTAEAYYRGNRVTVNLSDYKNHWVTLFFYASDFTFV